MGMFGIGGKPPLSQAQRDQLMASIAPQIGQAQAPSIAQTAPIESGMMQQPSLGAPQHIKPHFMDKGSTSRGLLFGALGGALDGVARFGGAQPGYANAMQQQQEQEQALADRIAEERRWHEQLAAKSEAERSIPQLANLGGGGLATWSAKDGMQVIRDPQDDVPDWQLYANQYGEIGTPEYTRAAQDYVLRSGGPTAAGYKRDIKQTIPGKAAPTPRASSGRHGERSGGAVKLPSGFILD